MAFLPGRISFYFVLDNMAIFGILYLGPDCGLKKKGEKNMTKHDYIMKRSALYMTKVCYGINEPGDAENTAIIKATFDMGNIIKNALSDAAEGCRSKGLESTARRYEALREQMWEQDKFNGHEDIYNEIDRLIKMEEADDEAHEE